jgi:hypothetical protein
MPLMLTEAERAMLHALAAPIDANRRPEFMGAVTTKLEAAGPAAVGPGRSAQDRARSLGAVLDSAARPSSGARRASRAAQRLRRQGAWRRGWDSNPR